jgi:hypothetical protein
MRSSSVGYTPKAGLVLKYAHAARMNSGFTKNRHNRPISAHFHSGGAKFAYFGEDLGESV